MQRKVTNARKSSGGNSNDDLVSRYGNSQMMPLASRMSSYMLTKKANEKSIAQMNHKIAFTMINVKATRTNDVQQFMKFYTDKTIPAKLKLRKYKDHHTSQPSSRNGSPLNRSIISNSSSQKKIESNIRILYPNAPAIN